MRGGEQGEAVSMSTRKKKGEHRNAQKKHVLCFSWDDAKRIFFASEGFRCAQGGRDIHFSRVVCVSCFHTPSERTPPPLSRTPHLLHQLRSFLSTHRQKDRAMDRQVEGRERERHVSKPWSLPSPFCLLPFALRPMHVPLHVPVVITFYFVLGNFAIDLLLVQNHRSKVCVSSSHLARTLG